MKKMNGIKEKLLEVPFADDYVFPSQKRKWTIELLKWCETQWNNYGHINGIFVCGCMNICDYCSVKKIEGCKDCVEAIKEVCKKKNIKIDYNDFDFEKLLERVEYK